MTDRENIIKCPCGHDKIGCDHYNREGDCTHISDEELLQLAAKAAGIRFHAELGDWLHQDWCRYHLDGEFCTCGGSWNPLKDDGDALRLAVKLSIHIEHAGQSSYNADRVQASPRGDGHLAWVEMYGDDKFAATRRAIVHTAADLGRQMP